MDFKYHIQARRHKWARHGEECATKKKCKSIQQQNKSAKLNLFAMFMLIPPPGTAFCASHIGGNFAYDLLDTLQDYSI